MEISQNWETAKTYTIKLTEAGWVDKLQNTFWIITD
jgi:hypothetical protein